MPAGVTAYHGACKFICYIPALSKSLQIISDSERGGHGKFEERADRDGERETIASTKACLRIEFLR